MDTSAIRIVTNQIRNKVIKNSPTILTTLGVGGFLTTVFLAVSATPEAIRLLDDEKIRRETDSISQGYGEKVIALTPKEVVQLAWRPYIPAALTGAISIACVIGATSINNRRTAALTSLYAIMDSTLREYQAKVVETIGASKEQKVKDEIAKDKLDAAPVDKNQIIITGKGDMLCFDSLSGRYFKNDIENIRRIQNNFNHELLSDMYLSLNDLYSELGLEPTEMGRDMGWSLDYGMLDIIYSSKLATDGTPCIVLTYRVGPRKL